MASEGSQKHTAVAEPEPIIAPGHTLATVTDKISSIVLTPGITKGWLGGFTIAVMLFLLLNVVMVYLFTFGVGIWGINVPVAWAFAITNFVWWIGIGHAGTLISAFLLLMHHTNSPSDLIWSAPWILGDMRMSSAVPLPHLPCILVGGGRAPAPY